MEAESKQLIYPFLDCLFHANTWDDFVWHQHSQKNTLSSRQLKLQEPSLHIQNLPNPLTANEHSCSLDCGDLNSGFVMTLVWCSKAF